jgi:hypothetical protein
VEVYSELRITSISACLVSDAIGDQENNHWIPIANDTGNEARIAGVRRKPCGHRNSIDSPIIFEAARSARI